VFAALSDFFRLARVGLTLARHDVVFPGEYTTRLPWPGRVAGRVLRLVLGRPKGRDGERFARALERLGPAYIKFGQFLAGRPDILGNAVTDDLARLKDKVPPFSQALAQAALKAEFGEDAGRLFGTLPPPIAAASIAQVHRVETAEGIRAVKILRPGVEKAIALELRALKRAARLLEARTPDARRLRPVDFIETVGRSLELELDLRLEAGAASEFAERARAHGYFTSPEPDWSRTSKRVLTTDWVEGTPLTAPQALSREGLDRPALASAVTRGFLSGAIVDGFFHADMHEGNMILTPEGKLALVDFGIVGRVGRAERRYLAEILLGFIRRDYTRIAEVHFEAGYVKPPHTVAAFAQALRAVGEPIHGKTASEVSMGRVLMQLFDFTDTFDMAMQPALILLQKTMVQVEGVARLIDPDHDIWAAAKPVVEPWVRAEFGPEGQIERLATGALNLARSLERLPLVLDRLSREDGLLPDKRAPDATRFGWDRAFTRVMLAAIVGTTIICVFALAQP
jgi:ubiquinone biosynthesis protein